MINTREIAQEYRLSHWAQVMRERTESGLSIKAYCKQIGICANTYFYWQRRLREAACEKLALNPIEGKNTNAASVSFTEIMVAEPIAQPELSETAHLRISEAAPEQIQIEISNIKITVGRGYPTDKLAALLREMTRPC